MGSYWYTLFFCIAFLGGVSHGMLGDSEKAALAEFLSAFPNLGTIPTSEFAVDGIDYGGPWTNNFDNLCLGGDGYEYYGLYCSNGHISGITVTEAWEPIVISPNYWAILGLNFLKNVTFIPQTISGPMQTFVSTLAAMLPLELLNAPGSTFLNGSFGYPSPLRDLRARLSYDFDLTAFVGLRSLDVTLSDSPPPFYPPPSLGIWPTSLESLRIRYRSIPLSDVLALVGNLTNLKSLTIESYDELAQSGTLVSDSIEFLDLIKSYYPLTINSSSLKTAVIDTNFSPMVLNTPNIQKLTIASFNDLPSGFTELYHLEELTLSSINVSRLAFPNLSFAVNLTSLSLQGWTVEPSELSSVLCMVAMNNPKLSSLKLANMKASTPGSVFDLPACLRDAVQLKSVFMSGYSQAPSYYPFRAESLTTALPTSIEKLIIYPALDSVINIYNFTQFGQLKELHLEGMYTFEGEMKSDYFSFFPNLEKLYIDSVLVNGTIPSIGWTKLRSLTLFCGLNQWTGLDSAPVLQYLHIRSTALETIPNDIYLVGLLELEFFLLIPSPSVSIPTPSFWTRLPKLNLFSIASANLSGPIISSIAAPRLRWLSLMDTSGVCGELPDFDIPTTLDQLFFSGNRFSGSIPQSWETNLSFISGLYLNNNKLSGTIPPSFLSKKIQTVQIANLDDNYFSGPVWNISRNYTTLILSHNNFNICDSLSLPSGLSIDTCTFLNVSMCPGDTSECFASWNTSCTNFECLPQASTRVPLVEECVAPPPVFTTAPPVPAIIGQCPQPEPPGFECVEGQWISNGSVSLPSITFPANAGEIVIYGNLSANGSLTFDGVGTSVVVEGCVTNVPTEVIIIIRGDEKLKPTTILSQKGSNCQNDLSLILVSLIQDKNNCKQVKSSTKGSTQFSLVVIFDIDSHKCNNKWIILGSVLGGVLLLFTVGLTVLYRLSPNFRAFVRSCNPKKLLY